MTIIPTRAMQLLERALADNEENIQLAARENDILVRSGRATIYSRLVEGRYPKWRDCIEKNNQDDVAYDMIVGHILAAASRAAITLTDKDLPCLHMTSGNGTLKIESNDDLGNSVVEAPIAYDGPTVESWINATFLIDALKPLDRTASVEFRWKYKKFKNLQKEDVVSCVLEINTTDGYLSIIQPVAR